MRIDYRIYEPDKKQRITFLAGGYVCIFICVFLFFRSIPVSAIAGFMVWFFMPRYCCYLAEKRRGELGRQFKDLLVALSSSIESGRQMEESLIEARDTLSAIYGPETPIMIELDLMCRGIRENNENDQDLLTSLAERSGCEDIGNFVQVYLTCRGGGGDIGRIITHTTEIMTEKMKINEEIAVFTAQKRLEGRIISIMPFAMLMALNLLSPSYIVPLYEGLWGRLIMLICLIAISFGIWLMERLTNVDI